MLIFAAGCGKSATDETNENQTGTTAIVTTETEETTAEITEPVTEATTSEPTTEPTTTQAVTEPLTTAPTTVTVSEATTAASTRKIINLSAVPWYLVLANGDNQLPDDFTVNDADIMGHGYSGYKFSLDSRIVDIWNQMYLDAQSEGYNIAANSSFRLISDQKILFEREVSKFTAKGYSRADAEVLAAKSVMYPGCSDHNLGLAVDILSTYVNGESAPEFKWLCENAENYGFVLRYPKDKEAITKVKYEPWHWRYVGVEAAKEMNSLNMCLEEYHIYKGIVQ